jgi:hypothetical protein
MLATNSSYKKECDILMYGSIQTVPDRILMSGESAPRWRQPATTGRGLLYLHMAHSAELMHSQHASQTRGDLDPPSWLLLLLLVALHLCSTGGCPLLLSLCLLDKLQDTAQNVEKSELKRHACWKCKCQTLQQERPGSSKTDGVNAGSDQTLHAISRLGPQQTTDHVTQ